ncbi:MAG TPA: class I SAM-dependent methyltransferase, partial [Pilimelia sp.]|nr:class I SAM-dependent methyltransferase [Pilimelia sp.]
PGTRPPHRWATCRRGAPRHRPPHRPADRGVPATTIDLITALDLYHRYADELCAARYAQRALLASGRRMRPKLDDIEAELTYLLVRHVRPARVVEIGAYRGWSTTWLLRALADNGVGELHSYDAADHVRRTVPGELSAARWRFHHGDVRAADLDAAAIDYLFVDAAHTASFARWYVGSLLERLGRGTPVSVHDVYRRSRAGRFGEGRVVLDWLAHRGIRHFTASAKAAPEVFEELCATRRVLGLGSPIHRPAPNPMIFFVAK